MLYEDQASGGPGTAVLTADPWTPPQAASPPPRRQGNLALIGMVVVLTLALVGGSRALLGDGPSHPSRWDPRVSKLAAFVEAERGLSFEHPVFVDFLPESEFVAAVTQDEADLSAEDRREFEEFEALARAVGLSRGDVDLFGAGNQLAGEGILALYDPDTDRVRVRGTKVTVGVRVTLVHELTHALQDQHFDLSRQGTYETDAQNSAFEAVIEGDAMRIEAAYADTLSETELEDYLAEQSEQSVEAEIGLETVPDWLGAYFGAPYALGEPFVRAIVAADGRGAANEALRHPPASEEHLMNAVRYLDEDQPKTVKTPALQHGDRLIDEADFGTFSWLIVLAERIPAPVALQAVDGWGGDAYIAFERDGRVCARAAFVGDTRADTEEMADALSSWADAMPSGAASVTRAGDTVELLSCDPGVTAEEAGAGGGGVEEAMTLVSFRAAFFADELASGASERQATCFASAMVEDFSVAELQAPEWPPDYEGRVEAIFERCA